MSRAFKLFSKSLPALLPGVAAAILLSGCQSPQGAAETKQRLEAGRAAEAGFLKWRTNYRKASEQVANAPAWAPAPGQPDTKLAVVKKTSYSQVHLSGKVLAMTFDDGPHPSNTPRLLDMLKQRHLKATFFVVGQNAKEHPEILRRIIAEGHEIANHTWSHAYLTKLSVAAVRKEFADTRDVIIAATGVAPKISRPPYGAVNSAVKSLLMNEFGYTTILWSVDPEDWKRPGVSVVTNRLVTGAHPGAILLAHDIHAPTIEAMPATFDRLLAQGYKFVTVSQLIQMEEAPATPAPAAAHAQLPPSTAGDLIVQAASAEAFPVP